MRQTWLLAIVLIVGLFVIGAPVVQAAAQKVKVVNTPDVKIQDTGGDKIDSKKVPDMGLFQAPGTNGAVAVRTFAGGTGLLGAATCDATSPYGNVVTVDSSTGGSKIITGLIIGSNNARVNVRAPDLEPGVDNPIISLRTNATNPNEFIGFGNGLSVNAAPLVFTCTTEGGGNGEGHFVVLGQGTP
jgi:hypothetical protein